jgi:flagellar biosynthesis/type III secretory pathway M-ring protein FliF/YscJ
VNGDTVSSVSPGIGAFLAFFALAIALWLLMRNMNSRMRRMSYRAEEAQREAEAEAAQKKDKKGKKADVTPATEDDGRGGDQTGGRSTQT